MIQNRDEFLAHLAGQLGRKQVKTIPDPLPEPVNDYATTRFTDLTPEQLQERFMDIGTNVMLATCSTATQATAGAVVLEAVKKHGGPVFMSDDVRLQELGVVKAVQEGMDEVNFWSNENNARTRLLAERAKTSVVFADYGIAETGFVVLIHDDKHGRTTSLLPEHSIVVVRRSSLLPRVAQFAEILHRQTLRGERTPSGISVIGGPSTTADVELIKVVGVHGPLTCHYVIIED